MFPAFTSAKRQLRVPSLLLSIVLLVYGLSFAIGASAWETDVRPDRAIDSQQPLLENFSDLSQNFIKKDPSQTLSSLVSALDTLQDAYFDIWLGLYPTCIDWTEAVMGTYISGALSTLTKVLSKSATPSVAENIINMYFSEAIGAYFGQNALGLRAQAFDDMLWVVLGWLETIKFVDLHSRLHYATFSKREWYGNEYVPAFAHRARVFWELASKGWDTQLCDGGMIWSPYLQPYKNAITNELYVAASISMYLYFPGDNNTSPFSVDAIYPARDPKHLQAAIDGYRWLENSNFTDARGLYVDGFHITGQTSSGKNSTKCDDRNEMVYTYNQGVLLTGQRGLYEATGALSYLEDGHKLVQNTIAATGYNLSNNSVLSPPSADKSQLAQWYGLGRNGIIEDACDAYANCSQDGQTFKGIFFHHLTYFCGVLPNQIHVNGVEKDVSADQDWHRSSCSKYGKWIRRNAAAASSTKNDDGKFGMWWGANFTTPRNIRSSSMEIPAGAVDYRNLGVPQTPEWTGNHTGQYSRKRDVSSSDGESVDATKHKHKDLNDTDLNDRGRGRTVETQGGGISVLRALYEIVDTQ